MRDAASPFPLNPKTKKHRRFLGMGVMWFLNAALALTTVCVLMGGAAVLYLKSYPVTAPDWVQQMIEDRLAEVLPRTRVRFGEMAFVMDEGWQPRLRLRDVALNAPNGAEIARFNEASAVFATAPLLEGQVQPSEVTLSGIVVRLRRNENGSVTLRSGASEAGSTSAAGDQATEASSLPALIGQVDELLGRPTLAGLRNVDVRAVTLRYEDSRADRAWTVDGGRFLLTRQDDMLTIAADLALLSGGAGVATLSANYTSQIGQTAATFGVNFQDVPAEDIAIQGAAFAWLGVLRAPISGAVRSGLSQEGRFAPIAATLQIGKGVLQPNSGTKPIPFDGARSYFSYIPQEKLLRFDELSVRSPWITAQASGAAVLGVDEDSGKLRDLVGQISLQDMVANPDDLYESAVRIAGAEADFRLELDPFRVTLGRLQVSDQGKTLLVDGQLRADPAGWQVALDGRMDEFSSDRLLALWPERLLGHTRNWLQTNLLAGEVSNLDLAIRLAPETPPQTYVAFDYQKADLRFAKTLPAVDQGRGHFSLADNRLVVTVDGGQVTPPQGGPVGIAGSSFIIPDVRAKEGTPAVVRLETRSTIAATLSLLNMPPMSFMDKAKLPVALADGNAALAATLALTLKPGTRPTVIYHATGDLLSLSSDVLVPGRRIRADRLRIAAQNDALRIDGTGTIDGVAFDASYRQPLGPGAGPGLLSADTTLDQAALQTFGVALPQGSVAGQGRANVDIVLQRGAAPQFDLRSDLRGLRIAVPQVSWVKAPREAGRLRVRGVLGPVPEIEQLDVSGPGLSASGNISFNADKSLNRIRFDKVEVGNWLDVPLDLIGQGAGNPVQVVLRGGSLDLRRAEFGASSNAQASAPMQVALDRLQISDTIALTNMTGRFATAGGLDGNFNAQLNGAAAVQGRVSPQDGRSAVRLTSADAGDVLRAAGLLKQVVGGQLSLLLLPVGKGGAFDGRLTIGGVTVRDAPGIAALLNAVSVVGLINELNGDGIFFNDVEATFRLTPNLLTLTEASAVGASMGISMDGTYALDTGVIGMQGVVSPVYLLNGIGSLFTRKGEGVIGFNYTLKGQARTPDVSVNPLSALAPAMFRELFRARPPELPEVDGITKSILPQPEAIPKRPVAGTHEGR